MSTSRKTNSDFTLTDYFPFHIGNTHEHIYNHWFDSVDQFWGTVNQFADATQQAVDVMHDTHAQTLGYFLPTAVAGNEFVLPKTKTTSPSKKKQPLDTVAIVTGGVGGIGSAICERLYQDGNRVIATYIKPELERAQQWQKDYRSKGYHFEIVELDVTDFKMCKRVANKLLKDFGQMDILVNCAGITQDSTLRKMEPEQWQRVLETNLDSVFHVTKSFLNGMLKRKYGRIVNISSVNGQKGQFGQTNYSASKAGMIGFSRSLAVELADTGITVNTVCPGYVGTSMMDAIPEEILNGIIDQIPVGRLAKPSEIADAVGYLAANSSAYITGTEIAINGGLYTG